MKIMSQLKMSNQLVHDAVSEACAKTDCSPDARREFENARLPLPMPEKMTIDSFHANNLRVAEGERWVWFVTRGDPQSVFFDEESGLFGCCWGPDKVSGGYTDLGFRSQDPVEMYLV